MSICSCTFWACVVALRIDYLRYSTSLAFGRADFPGFDFIHLVD